MDGMLRQKREEIIATETT